MANGLRPLDDQRSRIIPFGGRGPSGVGGFGGGGFGGGGFPQQFAGGGGQGPPEFGRGRPRQLLGQADVAGFFSPFLPSSFLQPLIQQQVGDSQARMRQALLGSKVLGRGDPSMSGFAALMAMLGEQGNLARTLAGTRSEAQLGQLKFLQDLLRDFSGVSHRGGFLS